MAIAEFLISREILDEVNLEDTIQEIEDHLRAEGFDVEIPADGFDDISFDGVDGDIDLTDDQPDLSVYPAPIDHDVIREDLPSALAYCQRMQCMEG